MSERHRCDGCQQVRPVTRYGHYRLRAACARVWDAAVLSDPGWPYSQDYPGVDENADASRSLDRMS